MVDKKHISDDNQIVGWELANPDPKTFTLEVVDDFGKCANCDLADHCDGLPDQSIRRLIPRNGRLIPIGEESSAGGELLKYFALVREDNDVRFLLLKDPIRRWTSASYITIEEVPAWSLQELKQQENIAFDGRP